MGKVLVFGSINTDLVTYVDRIPAPGETVSGGTFMSFPGGKGANQAVAAARAGAEVSMFACLGDDPMGAERKRDIEAAGIFSGNITVRAGVYSGIAQIIVDKHGENIIAVAPGANSLFRPDDITLPQNPANKKVVCLFQNEIPPTTTEATILKCKQRGMTTVWNTAPACREKPAVEALNAVDYLICNRSELAALAGQGDIETCARALKGWGVRNVIVTLGAEGSIMVGARGIYRQPAFIVKVVDTVGAGDCFCGVFAGSLASGMSIKDSLRTASAAAAICTTRRGAQTSMPFAAEVDAFLSEQG